MNEFADRAGANLFREHPEWHAHKRENPKSPDELFVEVPAPSGSRAKSLQVFTEDGEVFVLVTGAPPELPAESSGFDGFITFIDAILDNRIRFAVYARDGEWVRTDLLENDETPQAAEAGVAATIVSWNGQDDEPRRANA